MLGPVFPQEHGVPWPRVKSKNVLGAPCLGLGCRWVPGLLFVLLGMTKLLLADTEVGL